MFPSNLLSKINVYYEKEQGFANLYFINTISFEILNELKYQYDL